MLEWGSLFILGLVNGGSVCALSCMHYLGPYLLAEGQGFKPGLKATGWFLSGKLVGYTALGGAAGLVGQLLTPWMETWGKNAMALGLFGLALFLWLRPRRACPGSSRGEPFSLFGLGLSTGAVPCPALAALLLAAGSRGSVMEGAALGVAYGLGIALSPLFLIGGGLAHLGRRFRLEMSRWAPALRGLSVVVIVLLGAKLWFTEF